jgi:hypothetical protein
VTVPCPCGSHLGTVAATIHRPSASPTEPPDGCVRVAVIVFLRRTARDADGGHARVGGPCECGLAELVRCARRECDVDWRLLSQWQPSRLRPVDQVMRIKSNTHYNATICAWTFAQHRSSYRNYYVCYRVQRINEHTCPSGCLQALSDPAVNATVNGQFPYHDESSICVAAIHAVTPCLRPLTSTPLHSDGDASAVLVHPVELALCPSARLRGG